MSRAAEIDEFLASTAFTGYQSVPLPEGRAVPGRDHVQTVEAVFGFDVTGKSVLDVGCYYGRLSLEAVSRGARRAVGLEADPERHAVAQRIAALHGNSYEVRLGRVEDLHKDERFDVILLLNVIHHLTDPVAVLRHLAAICDDTLIVEFPTPGDRAMLARLLSRGRPPAGWQRLLARAGSAAYRRVGESLPLVAVGSRQYHQVWYFSPAGFRSLCVVHLGLFKQVIFTRSLNGRYLAFCSISDSTPQAPVGR